MKIYSTFVAIILFVSVVIIAAASTSTSAAQIRVKSPYDQALERRMKASQDLTAADVDAMHLKDIREHLSWRGEICADCDKPEQLKQALVDHIVAKTELSPKKYSETSAKLRSVRRRADAGDNPFGNSPHEDPTHPSYNHFSPEAKLKRFEARRKKHEDPNDPMAGLKNVMGAHGYDVKNHPATTNSHAGHKELHEFIATHKKRAREFDQGRNPAYVRAMEQTLRDKLAQNQAKEKEAKKIAEDL
jgi:hypothetical protein